ncbi:uncharacterized protein LOC113352577 [Papaver somniferum]|uniref:uncharacterized protein LOC113352577 n=1 Tax=Papaver somniferum TaxID=3469 RepID=UPI000E6FF490|nr:uncharacterized protein LOC113352577 [Papaver somniferum]
MSLECLKVIKHPTELELQAVQALLCLSDWLSDFFDAGVFTIKLENMEDRKYNQSSLEYWDEKTLLIISSAIGTPVKVDEVTLNYENGLYARVLVEIDLAEKVPHKLWIKTKYGGFMQSVLITKLPKFCPNCQIIGHTQPKCRAKKNSNQEEGEKQKAGSVTTTNLNVTPTKIMEKFDICETPVTQINITEERVQITTSSIPSGSGKFGSLQNITEEEHNIGMGIISPAKVLQIVEDNSLDTSVVKYVNGKNGSVSEERIPTTSWSKVIEKPSAPAQSRAQMKNADPKRRFLWSEMEMISELKMPWLILVDFNVITCAEEKICGKAPNKRSMLDFSNCIDDCGLIQAPKSGLQHSWSNGQHGNKRILCSLDKAMFNQLWLQNYADWGFKIRLRIASDHDPIFGGCANIPKPKKSPYKFQKMWISHPNFMETVQKSWSEPIIRDPAFVFQTKLKRIQVADSLLEVIPTKITEADQNMLDSVPDTEEIKNIVYSMDPDISPDPDGFL